MVLGTRDSCAGIRKFRWKKIKKMAQHLRSLASNVNLGRGRKFGDPKQLLNHTLILSQPKGYFVTPVSKVFQNFKIPHIPYVRFNVHSM